MPSTLWSRTIGRSSHDIRAGYRRARRARNACTQCMHCNHRNPCVHRRSGVPACLRRRRAVLAAIGDRIGHNRPGDLGSSTAMLSTGQRCAGRARPVDAAAVRYRTRGRHRDRVGHRDVGVPALPGAGSTAPSQPLRPWCKPGPVRTVPRVVTVVAYPCSGFRW